MTRNLTLRPLGHGDPEVSTNEGDMQVNSQTNIPSFTRFLGKPLNMLLKHGFRRLLAPHGISHRARRKHTERTNTKKSVSGRADSLPGRTSARHLRDDVMSSILRELSFYSWLRQNFSCKNHKCPSFICLRLGALFVMRASVRDC